MLPGIFLVALASGSSDRQEMSEGEKAIGDSNQTPDAGHCTTARLCLLSCRQIYQYSICFPGFYLFISSHFLVAGLIYTISVEDGNRSHGLPKLAIGAEIRPLRQSCPRATQRATQRRDSLSVARPTYCIKLTLGPIYPTASTEGYLRCFASHAAPRRKVAFLCFNHSKSPGV